MKSKQLLTIVGLVSVILLAGCEKDTFVEETSVCPEVILTNPLNGATGVQLNQVVTASFNTKMNPATITGASFIVSAGAAIPGTVTYTDSTASFTPSASLIAGTTYTGRVTTAAGDRFGNRLQSDYVWSFSTGVAVVPVVISTDPVHNETGVALNKVITATFSIPMNPLTISNASFILQQGASSVAGTVTYSGTTASFNPSALLLAGTVYTATITTGATDPLGTPIAANYTWSFTTGVLVAPFIISTDPADNATGVPLNKTVTATFNMPMDPLTITNATFTLKWGTTSIAGVVSYSGTTASFNPASDLLSNVVYTATITTGAQNLAGTPISNNYIWDFTTLNTTPPTVILTDPVNNATGVPLNKTVTATFSVPMNPLTINSTTFTLKQGTTNIPGVVTYSGTTASYNPTTDLLPGLIYTATITTGATNTIGIPLAGNYIWTFTTGVLIAPTVISTDPVDNATNVPLNKTVTATFSVPMDPLTITTSTFTLKQGLTSIPGVVTYSGTTASFNPINDLMSNLVYTATITTGAEDLAGTPLVNNYVWDFNTVNNTPPTVISTDPVNNAIAVALNKTVTATFSVPMDPLTITTSTFTLMWGTTNIPGVVTYSGTTASFNPNSDLLSNVVYTATITTGAENVAGTPMAANYVWNFTTLNIVPPTVISTDPLNNATGVMLNKTVTATFSVPMDPLTITTSTFTLKQGLTTVPGVVSYVGTTASYNPTSDLLSNVVYTATITTGAENVAGTPMASNYVWSFTTLNTTPPTVISTDPANNATAVSLNKTVTATFSVPMDPLTISNLTFTLNQGSTIIAGVVTYLGTTASFNPVNDLLPGLVYTGTITTGAENTLGIPLAANYIWTFTTAVVIAPTVILTDPLNNATNVALNKTVTATFSMPMDPLTITNSTFTLMWGTTVIPGVVTYAGSTASFNPNSDLLSNVTYTATITTGAENLAGTPMTADYVWNFTTVSITPPMVISTDPISNATGVPLNKTISATFNMPMDPLTITTLTFTLKLGTTSVTGVVTYSGTTAYFDPVSLLSSDGIYTATITTGAENLAGTPMVSNYSWNFSTVPHLGGPTVDLNSAGNFGILAGVGISNNAGFSVINDMDVGISPGVRSSVTGFPPGIVVNGAIYASDDISPPGVAAMLLQAKLDLTNAYLFAEGASSPAPATVSGDLGGTTLAPGIYKSTSTLMIGSGNLTLDAQGDPNAVWIFQIASAFTTVGGAGGSVILAGGAQAKNVFWQTGSSATIGDYTAFQGNVLALTSITMNGYSTAVGRMLARNGAVVLTHTNIINKP